MNYITTTELRTRSSELIDFLLAGESVNLVHRSTVVGTIFPTEEEPKSLSKEDVKNIATAISQLDLSPTTFQERTKNYRLHLNKKYG